MSPEEADALARRLLSDARTKLGEFHITHARRVSAALIGCVDEPGLVAALLHDVFENTATTPDELRILTGDREVVDLVEVLTRRPAESERDYLSRCAVHPVALRVKRADLRDKFLADDSAVSAAVAQQIRREAAERLALLDQLSSDPGRESLDDQGGGRL